MAGGEPAIRPYSFGNENVGIRLMASSLAASAFIFKTVTEPV
jgi:hypothetical protein